LASTKVVLVTYDRFLLLRFAGNYLCMRIVVTGSLGNISKPLTIALVQKSHDVTVITSNISKRQEIEALGAQAAIGKVDDADFLTGIFQGADLVYCMIPPDFSVDDPIARYQRIGNSYAKAIRNAGVKRVIHLSTYGAHLYAGTGLISGSNRVEAILDGLGIQLTHMRPTFFYYNLFTLIGMIKAVGYMGNVYGGNDKLAMVSPVDIADAIVDEIENPAGSAVRYVGSDDRSCNEVAKVLGTAIGMPDLEWRTLTKEQVLTSLVNNGHSEDVAHHLLELGEAIHTGRLREEYDKNKPTLGRVKLEDFAVEFAKMFNNGE